MSVYLHDIPLSQAQARLKEALQDANLWRVLGIDSIPLDENALGRVTAEPIWAKVSSPHYHASAMDGFAVRAISTNGAMPSTPVTLWIGPEAQYVDTGDPLPEWANSVIPIENVESLDENDQITKEIRKPKSIRIRAAVLHGPRLSRRRAVREAGGARRAPADTLKPPVPPVALHPRPAIRLHQGHHAPARGTALLALHNRYAIGIRGRHQPPRVVIPGR